MKSRFSPHIVRGLLALFISSTTSMASAQLHEQISVEGKYVPDIIHIDRLNLFPKTLKPSLAVNPLAYESRGVAAAFNPDLLVLPATGWRSTRTIDTSRGYIDLGTGARLNTTLSAGYRFLNETDSKAGVRLQYNSVSLWKPFGKGIDKNKYRYDGLLGFYGSHRFNDLGTLDGSLDWHIGSFDYYGLQRSEGEMIARAYAPTQTLNDVRVHLGWTSERHPDALFYSAGLNISHFGFRALPQTVENQPSVKGGRETSVSLTGSVVMPWSGGSSIGVDANLGVYFPTTTDATGIPFIYEKIENYGLLDLSPHYRFTRGLLDVKLGVNLDMAFNAGLKGNRYSFLHVSPDVNFALQQGQVGLYLNLTGGTEANSLSRLHQLDYYNIPTLINTRPEFTPLDAAFGVNLGPFSGFSVGLEARWKKTDNIMSGGWYQYYLNGDDDIIVGNAPLKTQGRAASFFQTEGLNLHGLSVSGRVGYKYGEIIEFSAEGSWQPQKAKEGYFNGYDRPEIIMGANVEGSMTKQLRLGAGINYRGKRGIWTQTVPLDFTTPSNPLAYDKNLTIIDGEFYKPMKMDLNNLTLLNIHASWSVSPDFNIWLQATNLLNNKKDLLPSQPLMGIGATAGFSWQF